MDQVPPRGYRSIAAQLGLVSLYMFLLAALPARADVIYESPTITACLSSAQRNCVTVQMTMFADPVTQNRTVYFQGTIDLQDYVPEFTTIGYSFDFGTSGTLFIYDSWKPCCGFYLVGDPNGQFSGLIDMESSTDWRTLQFLTWSAWRHDDGYNRIASCGREGCYYPDPSSVPYYFNDPDPPVDDPETSNVPAPATIALLGIGMVGQVATRRQRPPRSHPRARRQVLASA